jgi:hypothetical protein
MKQSDWLVFKFTIALALVSQLRSWKREREFHYAAANAGEAGSSFPSKFR